MAVRLATTSDLSALHRLIESAYRGDSARRGWTHEADLLGGQRTDVEALAESLAHPQQRVLVLAEDGSLSGSVQIEDKGEGLTYLGQLAVNPDVQAQGIGSRLIEAAEQLAVSAFDATRIEMTVIAQRPDLVAYYVRRGYAETGEARPFPFENTRIGIANTRDLHFIVLAKALPQPTP